MYRWRYWLIKGAWSIHHVITNRKMAWFKLLRRPVFLFYHLVFPSPKGSDDLISLNNWTRFIVGILDEVRNEKLQSMAGSARADVGLEGIRNRRISTAPALREIKWHFKLSWAIPKMTCTRETVVTIRIVTTQGGVFTVSICSDPAMRMTIWLVKG